MGDHYIPQYYLKGFSTEGDKTSWVYGKLDGRKFRTQAGNIANENGFYSSEVEQYLANTIEGPANSALKKIREKNCTTEEDKKHLIEYMTVMGAHPSNVLLRARSDRPDMSPQSGDI